jgi:hypothetical protein
MLLNMPCHEDMQLEIQKITRRLIYTKTMHLFFAFPLDSANKDDFEILMEVCMNNRE